VVAFVERVRVRGCSWVFVCVWSQLTNSESVVEMSSVLQCVAVCCIVCSWVFVYVWSHLTNSESVVEMSSVLQCVAVCCSVLQCVAVCCSVLQCDAVEV